MRAAVFVCVLASTAIAGDKPAASCRTFDRTPSCCRHDPPRCCDASLRRLLDADDVTRTCRAQPLRGEAAGLGRCDTFFGDEIVGRVAVELQDGGAAAMASLKKAAAEGGATVSPLQPAGADEAFLAVTLDQNRKPVSAVLWARRGGRLLGIDAEALVCAPEKLELLAKTALERLPAK